MAIESIESQPHPHTPPPATTDPELKTTLWLTRGQWESLAALFGLWVMSVVFLTSGALFYIGLFTEFVPTGVIGSVGLVIVSSIVLFNKWRESVIIIKRPRRGSRYGC